MPHETQSSVLNEFPVRTPRLSDPDTSDTQSPTSISPSRMEKQHGENGKEVDDGVSNVLLESTQQPILSNVEKYVPAALPPRASSDRSRRSRKVSPMRNGANDEASYYFSPRSIDMKKTDAMNLPVSGDSPDYQVPLQPGQRERSSRSSRRDHRRVNSDGVNLMRHGLDPYSAAAAGGFAQMPYVPMPPPVGHPLPVYRPAAMGGGGPYHPQQQSVRQGHNRVQSWQGGAPLPDPNSAQFFQQPQAAYQQSQSVRSTRRHRRVNSDGMTPVKEEDESLNETDQSPPPQMLLVQPPPPSSMHSFPGNQSFVTQSMRHPMQGWSSDSHLSGSYNSYMRMPPPPPSTMGYPSPPTTAGYPNRDPRMMQFNDQRAAEAEAQNSQQLKPKRKRKNRQRSVSSNAAIPGLYGSFFHGSSDSMDPSSTQSLRPSEFDARSEIMSLTSSFRPGSKVSFQTSPKTSAYQKQYRGGSMDDSRLNVYGTGYDEKRPLVQKIATPGGDGGEAAFTAQRKTKSKALQSMRTAQTFMTEVKGVEQQPACRNVLFLLLFLFHLVGMAYIGSTYGRRSVLLQKSSWDDNTSVVIDIDRVIYVASISGAFAVTVSGLALVLMTIIARRFVQVALFLLIAMSFAWGTIGIGVSSRNLVPITGFIALALSVGYTFVVWERIPFHAANLATALTAVRANAGAVLLACICQGLALAWANYYVYAIAGVYGAIENKELLLSHKMQTFVYVLFGVSFYWTFNVILNIVQVTVAGVVGRWWYQEGDTRSFCSGNVLRPFFHSFFYSLGSICCGSLLVGPVRLVRQFTAFFRPSTDVSTLMCMQQCLHCVQGCITTCIDHVADHLNPWAFTYVGLYGYGFMDAGHNAMELFKKRGWTMIISDDILPNILLMMSLVIGGITGCFAFLIENLDFLKIAKKEDLGTLTFSLGMVVGLVLTSVLFGIISSSVNAVIVCFASSPVDFERNHPDLSNEMRYSWREVWPGSMDVVEGHDDLNFEHERDFMMA